MPLASETDAAREYVRHIGRETPEMAWILSPFDSWHPNPFYHGPAVPHPESEPEDEEDHSASSQPSAFDDKGPF